MNGWKILPDGNLINLKNIEYIKISRNTIAFEASMKTYEAVLTPEWRKILLDLPNDPDDENI